MQPFCVCNESHECAQKTAARVLSLYNSKRTGRRRITPFLSHLHPIVPIEQPSGLASYSIPPNRSAYWARSISILLFICSWIFLESLLFHFRRRLLHGKNHDAPDFGLLLSLSLFRLLSFSKKCRPCAFFWGLGLVGCGMNYISTPFFLVPSEYISSFISFIKT